MADSNDETQEQPPPGNEPTGNGPTDPPASPQGDGDPGTEGTKTGAGDDAQF
jgi:hypothetical protein